MPAATSALKLPNLTVCNSFSTAMEFAILTENRLFAALMTPEIIRIL
jgi:hypothetical protein